MKGTLKVFIAFILSLSLSLMAAPKIEAAGPPSLKVAKAEHAASSQQTQLFADLADSETPELLEERAGGLTDGELIISVVFMIVFFPLGLVLLIVFIATDDDDDLDL